jgi:hypothetical protein
MENKNGDFYSNDSHLCNKNDEEIGFVDKRQYFFQRIGENRLK